MLINSQEGLIKKILLFYFNLSTPAIDRYTKRMLIHQDHKTAQLRFSVLKDPQNFVKIIPATKALQIVKKETMSNGNQALLLHINEQSDMNSWIKVAHALTTKMTIKEDNIYFETQVNGLPIQTKVTHFLYVENSNVYYQLDAEIHCPKSIMAFTMKTSQSEAEKIMKNIFPDQAEFIST